MLDPELRVKHEKERRGRSIVMSPPGVPSGVISGEFAVLCWQACTNFMGGDGARHALCPTHQAHGLEQ